MIAKYAIEHWTRLPCEVELASEFRYRDPVLDRGTLTIAISQSGETLDTLMAVRHAREQDARVLAICNSVGSTLPRESDAVLYTRCGPEVGVAATKTFLGQVAACLLVGLFVAQVRGVAWDEEVISLVEQLQEMPELVARTLEKIEPVRELARQLVDAKAVLFLGRHVGFPVALEGALKLKELAYMHAEGFAAGELKHGPIALIEDGHAGRRGGAVAPRPLGAARQGAQQHSGGTRPRRPHDRHRRGGRRQAVVPYASDADPGAAHADAAGAAGHDAAAAGLRLRAGAGPRALTSTSRATWRSP